MYMDEVDTSILPTSDYVFKRLFGVEKNKDILISFLNAIFQECEIEHKIVDLQYKNTELSKDSTEQRKSVLDVRAQVDNNYHIDIEVQTIYWENIINRSIVNNALMLSETVKAGDDLYEIPKVFSIWIIKEKIPNNSIFFERVTPIEISFPTLKHSKFGDNYKQLSDSFCSIFIFLKKFKEGSLSKDLEEWLNFMDNKMITDTNNKYIVKATTELNLLRGNSEIKERHISEIKAILRDNWNKREEEEMKKKEEEMRRKEEEEREREYEERKREYEREYKEIIRKEYEIKYERLKEGKIEIVKNMLAKGYKIEDISEITGLSKEEINNLK